MPDDGWVLCLCGNPDNCSCPPAPVTAEDLATRIVRWTTDGKPNVQVGDQILDQGEMCTIEDVYVEGLGNGSPWMHVSLRDPRAADTGLPVHAAEFSGAGFVAVRSAALAGDPGNLPARMAEAIVSHEWADFPRSAHNQHNYYAECAVCQRDVPRIAEVALSVRDELVAHLAARAAKAEARVGHAEAGAQLSSERLANVQQELAEAEGNVEAWTNTASGWQARAEKAEAAIERVRRLQELTIAASCRVQAIEQAHDTLAALNAETTTTPARETV